MLTLTTLSVSKRFEEHKTSPENIPNIIVKVSPKKISPQIVSGRKLSAKRFQQNKVLRFLNNSVSAN
jgi:hypothetical protein